MRRQRRIGSARTGGEAGSSTLPRPWPAAARHACVPMKRSGPRACRTGAHNDVSPTHASPGQRVLPQPARSHTALSGVRRNPKWREPKAHRRGRRVAAAAQAPFTTYTWPLKPQILPLKATTRPFARPLALPPSWFGLDLPCTGGTAATKSTVSWASRSHVYVVFQPGAPHARPYPRCLGNHHEPRGARCRPPTDLLARMPCLLSKATKHIRSASFRVRKVLPRLARTEAP